MIDKGVCSGQVVATTLVGIDAIIAIFAILKVGGVYLPVDKDNPHERIEYILSDSFANYYSLVMKSYQSLLKLILFYMMTRCRK